MTGFDNEGRTYSFVSKATVVFLFLLALLFFTFRGPYRAIGLLRSRDFALVYTAARCWMNSKNPYDPAELSKEFLYSAKGPAPLVPEKKSHPSIYPPTAMPIIAVLAWIPWAWANILWCLLSLALFAMSLLPILRNTGLSANGKWLLASALLTFSPTHTGLALGNPSVIVCSLVALAIFASLSRHLVLGGMLLGIAHCLKPHLSICALAVLVTWKCWLPVLISLVVPFVSAVTSALSASSIDQYWHWCMTLQQNITASLASGGTSSPSAANQGAFILLNAQSIVGLFTRNLRLNDAIVWMIAAAMIFVYLRFRAVARDAPRWRDLGFFSALTIMSAYHRYYDAQLLLLLTPFLLESWYTCRAIVILLWACLLLVAFPSQAALAVWLPSAEPSSLLGVILFRHQPLAVVAMGLLLIPWSAAITVRKGERI
jgi:hypothetical protein